MVRRFWINFKSWWRALHKYNNLVVKLGVWIILVGLAFRLLSSGSIEFVQVSQTPILDETLAAKSNVSALAAAPPPVELPEVYKVPIPNETFAVNATALTAPPPVTLSVPQVTDQLPPKGAPDNSSSTQCNIFVGDWVPNPAGPSYTNESCIFIESHQNCLTNGRPDTGYLYWRWSPRDCTLPQMNPARFLELMRNKTWALIGDSISRNHVQSLLCILSKVEQAIQVYHDEEWRSRRWLFPSYNFSISVVWSPLLAEAAIFEDYNGVSTSEIELHLDKLDKTWTELYSDLDYMIFSSGKWYFKTAIYYENNTIIGCHNCPKRNLTELGFDFAYRKVLRSVFKYIVSSNHKGLIIYRASTPEHFEGGEWYNGGSCKRTEPVKEGVFKLSEASKILHEIEMEEFERASSEASEKGVNLKLFDVTLLSLLRPDGHPGPYRYFQPYAKDKNASIISDCLHWCLPGPIDSWNDLVMEMVANG